MKRSDIFAAAALWIALVVNAVPCSRALAAEPEQQTPEVKRAVFVGESLWLLTDDGALSSIAGKGVAPIRQTVGDPVADICVHDGGVVVVTEPRGKISSWTLRRRTGDGWAVLAKIPALRDEQVALVCDAGPPTLVAVRRLLEFKDGRVHETRLSKEVFANGIAGSLGLPDQLLVGLNLGEWGGGLERIDRATGRVTEVEHQAWHHTCGPLNHKCDAVNGIAVDPWKPGCIIAAIGVVHFEPSGRLVRVCGSSVESFYVRPDKVGDDPIEFSEGQPISSVAFFGLVRRRNALWAVGVDGIYRFDGRGAPTIHPLPAFRKVGNFRVSFALPDVVLVMTLINQRHSMSGVTPIMVGR